jgi:acetamidase/formamidase
MIALIRRHTGLDDADIYMLRSLAADVRVTQVVNCNKGAHVMLEKRYLEAPV